MSSTPIDYHELIDQAMRGMVRQVLEIVSKEGFSGDQHAYITFNTQHPGVYMSQTLHDKYPEEMTIVLQHQFWDMEVSVDAFSVGLSFNGQRETLFVPFDALLAFTDPSVQFGLQFQKKDSDELHELPSNTQSVSGKSGKSSPSPETSDENKVVALDVFRKKK